MAKYEDHCFIDQKHVGRAFPEVHRWLDAFARKEGAGHRRHRHHAEGVEEVREKWGEEAARAAELHIVIDMGHIPTKKDWERSAVVTVAGAIDPMDAMGLLDSALEVSPLGIIVATATAYGARLDCAGCNEETRQLLTGIRSGEFTCVRCRSKNLYPEYRVEVPKHRGA